MPVALASGSSRATVLPREGGVVVDLVVAGRSVLARTPWADDVVASDQPARNEDEWVRRWRGGWQLCFPTTGRPDPGAHPAEGFHGAASQAAWSVVSQGLDTIRLAWSGAGLRAERAWTLTDDGLAAETTVWNDGPRRSIAAAEHLILGGAIADAVARGDGGRIHAPPDARVAALDYDGTPTGLATPWPAEGRPLDAETPAEVAALLRPQPSQISVVAGDLVATVTWTGLDHALVWTEFARSAEPPWSSSVWALGIEPTTTAHGAGSGWGEGMVTLDAGEGMAWSTSLRIAAVGAAGEESS